MHVVTFHFVDSGGLMEMLLMWLPPNQLWLNFSNNQQDKTIEQNQIGISKPQNIFFEFTSRVLIIQLIYFTCKNCCDGTTQYINWKPSDLMIAGWVIYHLLSLDFGSL